MNKRLDFGGNLDHRLDTEIVFRIRHYWEIRKMVNGHSFIPIRQMAELGGSMHCPSSSSSRSFWDESTGLGRTNGA